MSTRKRKTITIKDVATRANVSTATVGRVIGDYGRVSAGTSEKVFEAVKALGYYPDAIAQSMKNKNTRTLGIIVSNICNPFFGTIVRAAEDEAEKNNYNVIICNTDEDIKKEVGYAETLLQKKVDGLIVASAYLEGARQGKKIRQLYSEFMPTVLIDRKISNVSLPTVVTDNFAASYNATKYLIDQGHTKIAIASGMLGLSSVSDRVDGYKKVLADNGIAIDEDLIIDCGNVMTQGGYQVAKELCSRKKNRPTAIMPLNSLLTEGVLKYLAEIGMRIPGQISVLGWDDFELATALSPQLTVVRQDPYAIGKTACQIIVAHLTGQLDDIAFSKSAVVVESQLITRGSVSALRTFSR